MDAVPFIEQTASAPPRSNSSSGKTRSESESGSAFGQFFTREVTRSQPNAKRSTTSENSSTRKAASSTTQKNTSAATHATSERSTLNDAKEVQESEAKSAPSTTEAQATQQAAASQPSAAATPAPVTSGESTTALDAAELAIQMSMEVLSAAVAGVQVENPPGEVQSKSGSSPGQVAQSASSPLLLTEEPARLAEAQTQEQMIALDWGKNNEDPTGAQAAPLASDVTANVKTQLLASTANGQIDIPSAFKQALQTMASAQAAADPKTTPQNAQTTGQVNSENASLAQNQAAPSANVTLTQKPTGSSTGQNSSGQNAAGLFSGRQNEAQTVVVSQSAGQTATASQTSAAAATQAKSSNLQTGAEKSLNAQNAEKNARTILAQPVDIQDASPENGKTATAGAKTPVNNLTATIGKTSSVTAAVNTEAPAAASQPVETAKPTVDPQVSVDRTTGFSTPLAAQTIDHAAKTVEARSTQNILNQTINQIEEMLKNGQKTLRVQLHPENLGQLELRVTSQGGNLQVTILAESAATQQALERHISDLQQTLIHSGVNLSGLSVGQHDASQQNAPGNSNSSHAGSSQQQTTTTGEELDPSGEAVAETNVYRNPYSNLDYRV